MSSCLASAKGQLAERLALLAAGACTLAVVQLIQARLRGRRNARKLGQTPLTERSRGMDSSSLTYLLEEPKTRSIPSELEEELFSRNRFFFKDGFDRIKDSFVVVVGLGGVGSHAAHMLARSGVRRLRLIDFDQVSLSSLNRHAVATWEDVGLSKATVLRNRLLSIIPNMEIDARPVMFRKEDADSLLEGCTGGSSGGGCFVLDCIDDLRTKAELIAYCMGKGLGVLSSMGAGLKSDPTRLHIATLAEASRDSLAVRLRWRLKKIHGVDASEVKCIYSSEEAVAEMLPLSKEQEKNPEEFGAVENFRVRVLPVLGTTPAIFGQAMACWILCELGHKPFTPTMACTLSGKLRHRLVQRLRTREMKVYKATKWPAVDEAVVEHVVNQANTVFCSFLQVWRGRCPVTDRRILSANSLELCRWDSSLDGPGCVPSNLVLMCSRVIKGIDANGKESIPIDKRKKIEAVLKQQAEDDW
ncbi:unnamed protein product [Discosporangium mesarthrocarpum]